MKFSNIYLSAFSLLALCSCSAVYEDLEPCPRGVDLNLIFTRNMEDIDLYSSDVQSAKVLIYGTDGNLYGNYDVDGNYLSLDLPTGKYRAIAYGGMNGNDSDFDFSHDLNLSHHYSELSTFIKGTRAPESSKLLCDQFHGVTEFEVKDDDLTHVKSTIDLTRNVNHLHIQLKYDDGAPISSSDYNIYVTADNYVFDHQNNIVPQGVDMIYRPHTLSEPLELTKADENGSNIAWGDVCIGRLTPSSNAHIYVETSKSNEKIGDIILVDYLKEIASYELPGASLDEYLDKQNQWPLTFIIEHKIAEVIIKLQIKDWTFIINRFDL